MGVLGAKLRVMASNGLQLFREGALRPRVVAVYVVLAMGNVAAWAWAVALFHNQPVLLGTAFLAYGLGLRHAVDADHIAAIDNVLRKLMQSGNRPVGVGFFFALGHSTVVLIAAAIAVAGIALGGSSELLRSAGSLVSTLVSAFFLFAVAVVNIVILRGVWHTFQRVRRGGAYADEELDILLNGRGLLARLFRPLFRLVTRSWHMFPLGFLFGLGFDTASEVALLGISASQAAAGTPLASILVFPALFAAGMSLVDTTDGLVMLGAYDWAFEAPLRKLYYNLTITFVSVVVAVLIGSIELLDMVGNKLGFTGDLCTYFDSLGGNLNVLGFAIIGVFIVSWGISAALYRFKQLDKIEIGAPPAAS